MPSQAAYLEVGPYTGMRDSLDNSAGSPEKAALLQNCYPIIVPGRSRVVGRPGFRQAGVQLGVGGARRGQWVGQFTRLDGTTFTICWVGGRMYTFNWGTRVWTIVAGPPTSPVVSTTARIYGVSFNDKMVFSDGVNKPFTWDGTTFVSLTNAPVAFGEPAIYYAKIFFIKDTERTTIVWSEENDPTTGYEAGGFNNAWTLRQTGTERLFALKGTNEALYYWRERSVGAIRGAVTPDFRSDGTREGISETIGTNSPAGVRMHEATVYFIDSDYRMHKITPGGGLVPLWEDSRETISVLPVAQRDKAIALAYTPGTLVLFSVPGKGATEANTVLTLLGETDGFGGTWTGWGTFSAMGMAEDASGVPTLIHLSIDGFAYDHGNPDGTQWDDKLNSGSVAIEHIVQGSALGYDEDIEKIWDTFYPCFRLPTELTGVSISYETPLGASDIQNISLSPGDSEATEKKRGVGWAGYGRWIRPKILHSHLTERFEFLSGRIAMYGSAREPAQP